MDRDLFERRLTVVLVVVGALLLALAVRLWQIQILQGEYFLRLAEENRIRITSIVAPRGLIKDRHGRPLILNRAAFTVYLLPTELRDSAQVIPEVARKLGMTPAEVQDKIAAAAQERPVDPVLLRRAIPKEAIAALEENRMDLPGVLVQVEPVRDYLHGTLAAHLLGYLGEVDDRALTTLRGQGYEAGELIGKDGVERIYDRYLKGRNGQIQAEVDAQGRPLRQLAKIPPSPGNTVTLGIDLDVQQAAEDALGSRVGAVVAMDPNDGTIVALASHPAFNPNLFATGITAPAWTRLLHDPLQPLLDRATPIQVARLVAAVANGGRLVTPHIVTEITSPEGQALLRVAPPPARAIHVYPQTLAILQAGLVAVVTHGTAASIQMPGLAVAGKTGTAENPHGRPHAWFAGYAPVKDPQLVVVALAENVGYGADFAAPIVQRVLQVAFGLPTPGAGRPLP